MTGLVAGIGAKAALGAAGARLKQISPRTWLVIGCALAALLGALWALHWYHGQIKAAEKRGSDAAYSNIAKQARELTGKANALNAKLAAQMRSKNDEEAAAIRSDAGAVLVRGPGAARCAPVAGLAGTSGRSVAAGGKPDAAGSQVPPDDRAAVPWPWLVDRAEQADLNRSEAIAWRDWYARFTAEWAKWNADAAKARATP